MSTLALIRMPDSGPGTMRGGSSVPIPVIRGPDPRVFSAGAPRKAADGIPQSVMPAKAHPAVSNLGAR